MKINSVISVVALICNFCFGLSGNLNAETFLGSSTNVNVITVCSNQVILISTLRVSESSALYGSFDITGQINLNGTAIQPFNVLYLEDYLFGQRDQSSILALGGPATLSFPADSGTNSFPVCVSFERINGTAIQSLMASSNSIIQVPAGKTCHFLRTFPMTQREKYKITVQSPSDIVAGIRIYGGEEFTGPVTLTLASDPDTEATCIYSFYLTDQSVSLPGGALQSVAGSSAIVVEKSTDLINWFPVIVEPASNDKAAFYKLSLSH